MTNELGFAPRVLFVANGILGWKTYSEQLRNVLSGRTDMQFTTYWRRPRGRSVVFVKRHDATGQLERLLRRRDPIRAYRGWLGRAIRDEVRRHAPDLVHFASHWPAGAMLGMRDPPPFTVSLDCTRANIEDDFHFGIWNRADLRAEAELLGRAQRLYPMSSWVADSLQRDFGIDETAIRIVPPAQDLRGFAPRVLHDGLPNLIFIGNDFQRKGGRKLVEWVRGPLAGLCHLHIVSAEPLAGLNGPGVTVHGRVEHRRLIADLLPRMDVMCLPTQLDMSPHVLVEAAAAGLPVVASRLGGIPDIVLEGRTGYLVDRHDDDGFVAALRKLIGSAGLRRALGMAALDHARQCFDAARLFNDMGDDIRALASGLAQPRERAASRAIFA